MLPLQAPLGLGSAINAGLSCSDVLVVAVITGQLPAAINPTGLEASTPEAPSRYLYCGPIGDVLEPWGCTQLPDAAWPSTGSLAPRVGLLLPLCPLEPPLLFPDPSVFWKGLRPAPVCRQAPAPGSCHVGPGGACNREAYPGPQNPIRACYSMQWCLRSAHHHTNIREILKLKRSRGCSLHGKCRHACGDPTQTQSWLGRAPWSPSLYSNLGVQVVPDTQAPGDRRYGERCGEALRALCS